MAKYLKDPRFITDRSSCSARLRCGCGVVDLQQGHDRRIPAGHCCRRCGRSRHWSGPNRCGILRPGYVALPFTFSYCWSGPRPFGNKQAAKTTPWVRHARKGIAVWRNLVSCSRQERGADLNPRTLTPTVRGTLFLQHNAPAAVLSVWFDIHFTFCAPR
jgi:hypothetical protein